MARSPKHPFRPKAFADFRPKAFADSGTEAWGTTAHLIMLARVHSAGHHPLGVSPRSWRV
jgi:hypothetical protein